LDISAGVTATVVANIQDANNLGTDNFEFRNITFTANTVLNMVSGVTTVNLSGGDGGGGGATINAFATTAATIVGTGFSDTINGSTLADAIFNKGTVSVPISAGDVLTGNAGNDTFTLYGSNLAVGGQAVVTAYGNASRVSDFAVGTGAVGSGDVLQASLTVANYDAPVAGALAGIQGQAGGAGTTTIQSLAVNSGIQLIGATTDLIKLTTVTAAAADIQTTFNNAIGTGFIFGFAPNTGVFVTLFDGTNNRMDLLLVGTGAANGTLATADVVQLVGTFNMTAADYVTFDIGNLGMLA
jgi:hypothetical protein